MSIKKLLYFGDIDQGYLTKLNRIYDSIKTVSNTEAINFNWNSDEYENIDIFINRNYPEILYDTLPDPAPYGEYLGEENGKLLFSINPDFKVIGLKSVCYDDEEDDLDSTTPVNDLREKMTHYLTDTGLCTVKIGYSEEELKELEPEFKSSSDFETSGGGDFLTYTFENIPYHRIIQFYNDIKPVIRPFKKYTKDHNKNIVNYSYTVEIRYIREHIREFHSATGERDDKITDINIIFTLRKIKHFNPHNNINRAYVRLNKELLNVLIPVNKLLPGYEQRNLIQNIHNNSKYLRDLIYKYRNCEYDTITKLELWLNKNYID